MKKWILAVCIVTLFITMSFSATALRISEEEVEKDGPGWNFQVFGIISKHEIVEYNGTEYIHARAVYIFGFFWNVSKPHPNLRIPTYFFNQWFNLPVENTEIDIWPTPYSNYCYIRARGTL